MSRAKYHHGNLRQELLDAAAVQLESGGIAALSLRQLAVDLKVARSAPYRHFACKDDLLHAIVERVSDDIRNGFQKFLDIDGSVRDRTIEAFRWYLDFAQNRPEFYRLVFSLEREWHIDIETEASSQKSFGVFSVLISSVSGISDERRIHDRAVSIWSMLHGFAMLRMNSVANAREFIGISQDAILEYAFQIAAQE